MWGTTHGAKSWEIVYYSGPVICEGFEIIPLETVGGQIFLGMGAGFKGRSPFLGEGFRYQLGKGRLGKE